MLVGKYQYTCFYFTNTHVFMLPLHMCFLAIHMCLFYQYMCLYVTNTGVFTCGASQEVPVSACLPVCPRFLYQRFINHQTYLFARVRLETRKSNAEFNFQLYRSKDDQLKQGTECLYQVYPHPLLCFYQYTCFYFANTHVFMLPIGMCFLAIHMFLFYQYMCFYVNDTHVFILPMQVFLCYQYTNFYFTNTFVFILPIHVILCYQ